MGFCPRVPLLAHNMKLLLVSCLAAVALAHNADYTQIQFAQFKEQFGKTYLSRAEHNLRFDIFKTNMKKIEEHNKSGASWKKAMNQFSDLTQAEFESMYLGGYKRMPTSPAEVLADSKPAKDLPAEVDWRKEGVITDVKNQGQCGSCWAFATTAMIESYAGIAMNGSTPILSSQQVTSCTPNPLKCGGTGGCSGSIPQLGYTYIQLFGHVTEDDYPYTSGTTTDTGDCMYDFMNTAPVVGITGYNTMPPNDQEAVMTHLAEKGPLAVAVYASGWGGYGGGVYDGCSFDSNIALNHAVQLVGYGTDETEGDYWLVRNSWGSGWGEGGYIRLQRQATPQCGTDSTPMDGTACVGGPGNDEQHVCGQCGVLFDVSYPLGAHEFMMP